MKPSIGIGSGARNWLQNLRSRCIRVFESICKQPQIYGFVSNNVRFARTDTFSYAIYFYVEESEVVVVAILQTSRDPELLQSRIP